MFSALRFNEVKEGSKFITQINVNRGVCASGNLLCIDLIIRATTFFHLQGNNTARLVEHGEKVVRITWLLEIFKSLLELTLLFCIIFVILFFSVEKVGRSFGSCCQHWSMI